MVYSTVANGPLPLPYTRITASGTAQNLVPSADRDTIYDITLTGACALTFSGFTAGVAQTITVVLRQDSTAGRLASLPVIAWPNGTSPTLNTQAGYFDVIQVTSFDGATIFGAALALAVQPPTIPGQPTIFVSSDTRKNTITVLDGPSGGSTITGRNLYRKAAGGAYGAATAIVLTAGVYVDTGLTNGTQYTYQATDVNAKGEGPKSAEVSGTPLGYLSIPANDSTPAAAAQANTASKTTTGFADIRIQSTLVSFVSSILVHSTGTTSGYILFTNTNQTLSCGYYKSGSTSASFLGQSTAMPASVLNTPIWYRMVFNSTSAAVTVGGTTYNANTAYYYYSTDGSTWNALGTATGVAAVDTSATGAMTVCSVPPSSGSRVQKMIVSDSSGNVLFNPDFTTGAAAGATTLTDTAATPNTFTINSPAAIV